MAGDDRRCAATAKSTRERCKKRGPDVCSSCGVCRVHGCNCGSNRGGQAGNKNAVKHGIYAVGLREDEHELWESIALDSLDDEIRLIKLQLRRAFAAQLVAEQDETAGLELSEVQRKEGVAAGMEGGVVAEVKTTRSRPDFRAEIHRLTGRIADLVVKRKALGVEGEDPSEHARRVRDALFQMDESMNAVDEAA
jgi:hypothetical protein